jgi:uncharacterized YkwD family protein
MSRKIALLMVIAVIITAGLGFSKSDSKDVLAASSFQRVNFVNAVVVAEHLNVRQGPSTKFPVICVLNKGQTVKVFGKLNGWYAIYEPATGCVGAASSAYLKTASAVKPPVAKTPATMKPGPAASLKPPQTTTATPPSGISDEEQQMLNLVNKARADAGAGPLAFDMKLENTARLKAQDMVQKNYFSHQSPTYGSPFDMMRQFGITFKSAGENIAGNSTVEGAFNAWMNSQGHRQNILNASYNYTGIGIVSSPTYGKIFVQQFIGR